MAIHDQPAPRVQRRGIGAGWIAFIVVVALALVALVWFAMWGLPNGRRLLGDLGGSAPPTTVSGFAADPGRFAGQRVRLAGTVELVLGPRGFLLSSPEAPGTYVVVVSPRRLNQLMPNPSALLEGSEVQVTGTATEFQFEQIEDELGIDFTNPLYSQYVGYPTVILNQIVAG